ncbi:hypothetical protein DFJ58DRAFT_839339 [Suillus subalutaceus]|uniref:uncharacterized protein n=1 Tax=Suillus subalutaceus TaxID=48586 RepID=UPI001B878966|nr:uncharacterized protein DFJ58DRAFT_839339 [Suillus subalutaceus]KAG1862826.1 hypothetical protein DFJ58DRAFT_839339 [Suillus subalutaceus]
MSTIDAPCCTCPSNATARPGQIVLNAQVKRRTKVQKNADDLALKEAKELKEAQADKGLKRLAGMQNEMEKAQEDLLTKKAIPVMPKPRVHKTIKPAVRSSDNHTDSMVEADEADNLQETVEQMDSGTVGVTKKKVTKKGGKTLIKDAISNMQKKINEAPSKRESDNTDGVAHVSDGKDSVLFNAITQKFALGGQVTNWVSNIKPLGKLEHPKPLPSASSTASTAATSDVQVLIWKPVVPAEIPDADDALIGSFADAIDDTLEHEATIVQGKGKSKVVSIFEDNVDFEPKATSTSVPSGAYDSDEDLATSFAEQEQYSLEPKPPFTQIDTLWTLKWKTLVDDALDDDKEASVVSDWSMDIDGPAFEDLIMVSDEESQPEPVVLKKEKIQRTTSSTSVSVASTADSKPPALKKAKVDQRWTKKYLPTVMLWAGSYGDIWNIPDDVLLLHAQLIFNVVYKELNITIVHGGVIHSLTAQCISEWHSNFSSTGIVIVLDFLMRNSDCDLVELAKSLIAGYAFLFQDPDEPNPLTVYHSPFVLQLLGTAHLNAISGYVDVPKLDMHALVTLGMSGVIALSAAAIERALNMFADKHLKVKEVLAAGSGKLAIKLPKILNKTTSKMTNTPFLFSGARWTKVTNSFIKSISNKPAGYIETTIQMARACTMSSDAMDPAQGSFDDEESEDDERAMLSSFLNFLLIV